MDVCYAYCKNNFHFFFKSFCFLSYNFRTHILKNKQFVRSGCNSNFIWTHNKGKGNSFTPKLYFLFLLFHLYFRFGSRTAELSGGSRSESNKRLPSGLPKLIKPSTGPNQTRPLSPPPLAHHRNLPTNPRTRHHWTKTVGSLRDAATERPHTDGEAWTPLWGKRPSTLRTMNRIRKG